MTNGERQVITALVQRALDAGYAIMVDDGGDDSDNAWLTDFEAIMGDVDACDFMHLHFTHGDEARGWIALVYGNASDGSEVISDYVDNAAMRAIVGDA